MDMIKAILFDFDGVLTLDATGSQSICNYVCNAAGLDLDLFKKEYKKYNKDLLYGRVTHEDMWDELCTAINKDLNIEVLYDSFINTPMNDEICKLIKQLKDNNYKTAMVTDNKKDRIDRISEYYQLDALFDTIIISAELGCGKDDEAIFINTIERLKVEASQCIFIDNQEKNLIVPKKMGMKVIFYNHEERNVTKLINQLRNYGLKV